MKKQMLANFAEIFGNAEGVRVFFAPGRVNLIGEHTDYNGGHVFPCALTIGTYGAVRKREDRILRFYSVNFPQNGVIEASLDHLVAEYDWANYPLGVIWAFAEKGMTLDNGFDLVIYGDIPNGSGLSSSASLEVLTGTILKELYDIEISNQNIALLSQRAENAFNGMNCGIMDQFASAMGKKDCAIFLDTADLSFDYAPIALEDAKIVVTNSKVKHSLVGSAYNDRRRECETALKDLQKVLNIQTLGDLTEDVFDQNITAIEDPVCQSRARHAVYENQRTVKAVNALKANDVELFGELMNASHRSLQGDYDVSCPEIDVLVEAAWKIPGVLGSRITGGGFGGCTVSIVKNESVELFKKNVEAEYVEKTGITPEFYVVEIGNGPSEL